MWKAAEKEDELGIILWCGPDSRRFSVDAKIRISHGGDRYIVSNLLQYLNPDVNILF